MTPLTRRALALIGHFAPATGEALKPLGDAFIKLVKMIIAPVIFLTVVTGIAGMRDIGKVGGVAAKAFAYFITVSSFALVVGLIVANVVQPGAGMHIDPATLDAEAVKGYAAKSHDLTLVGFLMDIIPETVAGAFVGGNILQVLFFSIPFGLALANKGMAWVSGSVKRADLLVTTPHASPCRTRCCTNSATPANTWVRWVMQAW